MYPSPSGRLTLGKTERLASKRVFETLFASGKSRHEYPIRIVWTPLPLTISSPVQVAFSVSKRNFKRAVDRNRIKRLMREAYRKNKLLVYPLLKEQKASLAVLLIYTGKALPDSNTINEKIILILHHLAEDIQHTVR
jgi:ribonuclease P protein component